MRPLFTPEELAEMAAADAEIEAQPLTMDKFVKVEQEEEVDE